LHAPSSDEDELSTATQTLVALHIADATILTFRTRYPDFVEVLANRVELELGNVLGELAGDDVDIWTCESGCKLRFKRVTEPGRQLHEYAAICCGDDGGEAGDGGGNTARSARAGKLFGCRWLPRCSLFKRKFKVADVSHAFTKEGSVLLGLRMATPAASVLLELARLDDYTLREELGVRCVILPELTPAPCVEHLGLGLDLDRADIEAALRRAVALGSSVAPALAAAPTMEHPEGCTTGATMQLHALCSDAAVSAKSLCVLLAAEPGAVEGLGKDGYLPLHVLCRNEAVTGELLGVLLAARTNAAKWKGDDGDVPLHVLCSIKAVTAELLGVLLDAHKDAAKLEGGQDDVQQLRVLRQSTAMPAKLRKVELPKHFDVANEKRRDGYTPLHLLCRNEAVSAELLLVLLGAQKDAAKLEGKDGDLPVHVMCSNGAVTAVLLRMLLDAHKDAAKWKEKAGWLPLHVLCNN
jgi:hypothetical protein